MLENSEKSKTGFLSELKSDWLAVSLIAALLAAGALAYPNLPDLVPSHWNIYGQVDRYSSRFWGAFGVPLMAADIYLLMVVVPRIDPRRENYRRFRGAYRFLKLGLAAFSAVIYTAILSSSMGYPVPVDRVVGVSVGLLFMVVGNFMGQFRHNYFVGIKTPWTLASEEVWQKTHRFASGIWVACGAAVALAGLFLGGPGGFVITMAAAGTAAMVPVIYSYVLYRKNH